MSRLKAEKVKKLKEDISRYLPECHNHGSATRFLTYCQRCGEPLENRIIPFEGPSPQEIGSNNNNQQNEVNDPLILDSTKIFTNCDRYKELNPNFSALEHNGIVWIGYGVRQYALLDLLNDTDHIRQVRKFRNQKKDEKPIRAFVIENWLVAWSNKRIIVEDLLAIANGNKNQVMMAFEHEVEGNDTDICPQPIALHWKKEFHDIGVETIGVSGIELYWLELEGRKTHSLKRVHISFEETSDPKPETIHQFHEILDAKHDWPYLINDPEFPDEMLLITAGNDQSFHYFSKDGEGRTRHAILNPNPKHGLPKNMKWSLRPYDESRGSFIVEKIENNKWGRFILTADDESQGDCTVMAKFDLLEKKLIETERIQTEPGRIAVATTLVTNPRGRPAKFQIVKDRSRIHAISQTSLTSIESVSLTNHLFVQPSKDGFMVFSGVHGNKDIETIKTRCVMNSKGSMAEKGFTRDENSDCINSADWTSVTKSIKVKEKSITIQLFGHERENNDGD